MLSDKSTVCPVNLLNIAHQKRGVKAAIVNAGKKLPMMSVMDAVSEKLITPILIINSSNIALSILLNESFIRIRFSLVLIKIFPKNNSEFVICYLVIILFDILGL